ncbi:hypothetical protein [Gordonia effusa]|uniref:hypothetical protein n=1 Tax=Gordonia effusa TaxID=263908 RepID=UPI00110FD7A5|nr:hypothetical protein [Gordonia effusa]
MVFTEVPPGALTMGVLPGPGMSVGAWTPMLGPGPGVADVVPGRVAGGAVLGVVGVVVCGSWQV